MNGCSLQAIYRFDIATKLPLHGDISYVDLAKLCQIHERDLRRILRFSMAFHRIFRESKKGFVAHTAASRQLAENPDLRDTLGMWYEDCWPSMVQVRKSLPFLIQTFVAGDSLPFSYLSKRPLMPYSASPTSSRTKPYVNHLKTSTLDNSFCYLAKGVSLANNTDDCMFDYLGKHPARAKRFANAMRAITASQLNSPICDIACYPWASIGAGTIVDIGGSGGRC